MFVLYSISPKPFKLSFETELNKSYFDANMRLIKKTKQKTQKKKKKRLNTMI